MLEQIQSALTTIRQQKPLILNLTNYVTMDLMANSLLTIGAAPIMSVCDEELEELIKISNAINLNIGTLDEKFIIRCQRALTLTKQYNKPVIFDPVGAGATTIRTKTARDILPHANIVRGNASEIMALMDNAIKTHGVEAKNSTNQSIDAAHRLTQQHPLTVVVSGEIDFIVNHNKTSSLTFGSSLMSSITGMGCTLTAVIAAFHAVIADAFIAAELATTYFGLCGNLAAAKTDKPGSFRTMFIDELYAADFAAMRKYAC